MKRLVPGLVIGALVLGSSAAYAQDEGGTLQAVKDRGSVVCLINGALPGMSVLNPETQEYDGMDADYCRAVAAAVLGDPSLVTWSTLTADQRATAIQTGEVDVIFRNTTNTLTRDADWGDFGPTIFYDGQGMMVRADSGITTLEELDGANICVTAGTTTELNLADQFTFRGLAHNPVKAAETETVYGTYESGACDAVTSDRSQLVGRRSAFANPDDHVLLDVVTWVVNATIEAEELGITKDNLAEFQGTDNPVYQRFLGETGDLGSKLGLENDFVVDVISAVGNYGEIYDRGFGPLGLERGLNNLWNNGGILYSPPFR